MARQTEAANCNRAAMRDQSEAARERQLSESMFRDMRRYSGAGRLRPSAEAVSEI